jgi:HD-GYP domain-containing protein (c-di-GMP phosphodiesterase class II)
MIDVEGAEGSAVPYPVSSFTFSEQLAAGLGDDLPEIRMDQLIGVVLTVLDARDPYTFGHSLRVTEIAVMIAKDMGLTTGKIRIIHEAAYLHDIGKVGIPDRVLNKTGRLTREEMRYMQAHKKIPRSIDVLADPSCPNAFDGHDDLMHSRRLL